MKSAKPKRPKKSGAPATTTNDDLVELADLAFDAMTKPGIAEGLAAIAKKEGITLDLVRDTLIAMTLSYLGQPVPPELRERVSTDYPSMGPFVHQDDYEKP